MREPEPIDTGHGDSLGLPNCLRRSTGAWYPDVEMDRAGELKAALNSKSKHTPGKFAKKEEAWLQYCYKAFALILA